MSNRRDLAIVGIGCRYPGGSDTPDQFWEMLLAGRDGFCDFPEDRWNADKFIDPDPKNPGRMKTQQAAFIETDKIKSFDADFFGINRRESEVLDPQQRLILEVSWEAFEDAGIASSRLKGSDVGVYVGGFTYDNSTLRTGIGTSSSIDQFYATASSLVMLSNRVSYFFDFRGPSLTIDTACSSSMVALNYACRDLWEGKTELAMVGGVNAMVNPNTFLVMAKGGFLSPDSRSKAFDQGANGYARGEGAGAIIVKPLKHAIEANDRVYAVIKGIDINQDGRTSGIASPNPQAQQSLIETTFTKNKLKKSDVVLVEAHGTGTAVGDVIEVTALSNALGDRKDDKRRMLGSVKGNIGHQEAGAGIAGIIKAALCLHYDQTVPQVNFSKLNPTLDLEKGSFEISSGIGILPDVDGVKLACINSFGYGGTNGHAILAQYPNRDIEDFTDAEKEAEQSQLFVLSAKSEAALKDQANQLVRLLGKDDLVRLNSLSSSLLQRRSALEYRTCFVANTKKKLLTGLNKIADGTSGFETCYNQANEGPVFVYTGMGPQWWGMGQQLYEGEPIFRKALDEADAAFESHAGWSILDEMRKPEADSRMARNEIAQPANFVLQSGLTKLLNSWGVFPSSVVGHSVGEVGAAEAVGALNLEDAAKVAFHRSRIQQTKAGQGRVLATGLSLSAAKKWAKEYDGLISIAAINSPLSIALAGDEEALHFIADELGSSGVFNRLLDGEVAYHSYQMDGLENELVAALQGITPQRPTVPLYSSVTGKRVKSAMHGPEYWWRNVREPVKFAPVIEQLASQGSRHFLEIGPNRVLAGAIRQNFANRPHTSALVGSVLSPDSAERETMLATVGQLWQQGCGLNAFDPPVGQWMDLPLYPWQKEESWTETTDMKHFLYAQSEHETLGLKSPSDKNEWHTNLASSTQKILSDHVINDRPVFPAAGYLECFLAASRSLARKNKVHSLADVRFQTMLGIPTKDTLEVRTMLTKGDLDFQSKPSAGSGKWRTFASAKLLDNHMTPEGIEVPDFPENSWSARYEKSEIYDRLAGYGLSYQAAFQSLEKAFCYGDQIVGHLQLPAEAKTSFSSFVPPSLVDGGLQLLALLISDPEGAPLPVNVRKVHLFVDQLPDELIVFGGFEQDRLGDKQGRLIFTDKNHNPVLLMLGIETEQVPILKKNGDLAGPKMFGLEWQPAEISEESSAASLHILPLNSDTLLASRLRKPSSSATEEKEEVRVLVCASSDSHIPDGVSDYKTAKLLHDAITANSVDRIVICTQHAWRVNPQDSSQPAQSAIWGVVRALGKENSKFNYILVDLDAKQISCDQLREICRLHKSGSELAIRDGNVFVRSLSSAETSDSIINEPGCLSSEATSVVVEEGRRGGIDKLALRTETRRLPADNEIEIQIKYTSINFKDVLKVLGVLTEQTLKGTFFERALGMEATGTIARVGKNYKTQFSVSDDVVFVAPEGCLQSHITFDPETSWVQHASDYNLALDQLCSVPTAFFTAHYALLEAGRLRKGETVLLQSASGGLGLSALQVARAAGANVIATAGTKEKRDFLRKLGIVHVFDSRSLDFEDQVLSATENRGVDVVLNFLPGDLMQSGVRTLAPFGRFVELGKADIGLNKTLFLGEFERNLSFHAVDLDHMLLVRKDLFKSISSEVQQNFKSGAYQPLSHKVYPVNEIKELFRELAGGQHIGKRVIDMKMLPDAVLPPHGGASEICNRSTYIVTGGYSGLGLETARWLTSQKAGRVVIVGRQIRESDGSDHLLADANNSGSQILMKSCDVSDFEATQALVRDVTTNCMPIRGIFHAAGIIEDRVFAEQTEASFHDVYQPKAFGAWALHQASVDQNLELDFFVLFSSISAIIGNAGQSNYAGANAYLDGLAEYRRSKGLPATSLSWGAIGGVGMVARDPSIERYLALSGIDAISAGRGLSSMFSWLPDNSGNVGIFQVDWSKWAKAVKPRDGEPVSSLIIQEKKMAATGPIIDQLKSMTEKEAVLKLVEITKLKLSEVYRKDAAGLSTEQPLIDMGLDSLMLAEFVLSVEEEIGIEIEFDVINAEGSLAEIAANLYTHIKSSMLDGAVDLPKQAAE